MGYNNYYKTLLIKLGCLEENDGDNHHISSGIARIDKKRFVVENRNKSWKSKERENMANLPEQRNRFMKNELTVQ